MSILNDKRFKWVQFPHRFLGIAPKIPMLKLIAYTSGLQPEKLHIKKSATRFDLLGKKYLIAVSISEK